MDVHLTPVNVIALAKALAEDQIKKARGNLSPGNYIIDAILKLKGTMKVGEDYESHIVAKADPWRLLAVALNKLNGATIDAILQEALGVSDEAAVQLKAKADEAMKAIKASTKQTCKGRITPRLSIEIVQETSHKQRAAA